MLRGIYRINTPAFQADYGGPWLNLILDLCKDTPFFRNEILKALSETTEGSDAYQLFELALSFALQGNTEARNTIYIKFERQGFEEDWLGATEIIELDGLNGLKHVAQIMGSQMEQEDDFWAADCVTNEACEKYGTEKVREFLMRHAGQSEDIKRFVSQVQESLTPDKTEQQEPSPRSRVSLDQVLEMVNAKEGEYGVSYMVFGRNASIQDLNEIYRLLCAENDHEKILRYLWVFRCREIPSIDSKCAKFRKSVT